VKPTPFQIELKLVRVAVEGVGVGVWVGVGVVVVPPTAKYKILLRLPFLYILAFPPEYPTRKLVMDFLHL
jgi:hypothetical protein